MSSTAAVSTTTSSFLDLNNEGVRHLSDGEYEEAAKLFHKAFSLLKGTINRKARDTRTADATTPDLAMDDFPSSSLTTDTALENVPHHSPRRSRRLASISASTSVVADDTRASPDDEKCSRRSRAATRAKRKAAHRGEEKNASSSDGACRKRQRVERSVNTRGSVERSQRNRAKTSVACGTLGRPLWLEPAQDRRRRALVTFASSILYNYAYTLHRMGTQHEGCPDGDASPRSSYFRRQAMSVYSKVFRLCGKRRCPVVQWLCCHNLQQLIQTEMQVTKAADAEEIVAKLSLRYQSLETRKVLILRALFSVGVRSDILYLSVLSLLGLGGNERPDSPAAAA
eukprot:CAMPEP_0194035270 /NCGR_PEP_ID=MMETSP0009_2-20130614/7696_1 /TAXON_ID=210454 /ORGANISM="Grammatophora oceanica, Strain CCMP 410" /LENGTH=340 /DNA_ID=CAMNT_0038676543 /DNA_START=32 /DNA_END=1054 /DNA_ORIENTATION=+